MSDPTYLEPEKVPAHLRGIHGYSGRKFKAEARETVTIPIDAGLWSGGSRDHYSLVRLADGRAASDPTAQTAPWSAERSERVVTLIPGFAVVRHSMFCGKDMGLTFYVHPTDIAPLLPPASEPLAELELQALDIIGGLKSFARDEERDRRKITREEYAAAVESLKAKGLLNKAGAVTVAGRNARVRLTYQQQYARRASSERAL